MSRMGLRPITVASLYPDHLCKDPVSKCSQILRPCYLAGEFGGHIRFITEVLGFESWGRQGRSPRETSGVAHCSWLYFTSPFRHIGSERREINGLGEDGWGTPTPHPCEGETNWGTCGEGQVMSSALKVGCRPCHMAGEGRGLNPGGTPRSVTAATRG